MLLTRSRLCPRASPGSSLHLHVLSTPPAFVLSQDQTLREELHVLHEERRRCTYDGRPRTRGRTRMHRRGLILAHRRRSRCAAGGGSKPGRTPWPARAGRSVRMLLSFQRPSRLFGRGFLRARWDAPGGQECQRPATRSGPRSSSGADCSAASERAQDAIWTWTSRCRGRSSKSSSTSCCQVPSTRRRRPAGWSRTARGSPRAGARGRCVVVETVVGVVSPVGADAGARAPPRSWTPPGSYSIVVTAAVEPITKTSRRLRDVALRTTRARPR